jgi:hypothetical protein
MECEMTDHKPMPVAGYVPQSQENIDLANELKYVEERYLRLLDKMLHPPMLRSLPQYDQRFLALARTSMQEANMWAVRAIFQPTRIKFPEDSPQSP